MGMRFPQRRIDDRLRKLCAKAIIAPDGDRETILQEVLELVHQKSERLKRRAARLLLKGSHLEPERKSITHMLINLQRVSLALPASTWLS